MNTISTPDKVNRTYEKICKVFNDRCISWLIACLSVGVVSYNVVLVDKSLESRLFRIIGIGLISLIKLCMSVGNKSRRIDYKLQDFFIIIALSLLSVIANTMDIVQKVPNNLMLSEFCGFLFLFVHCVCLCLFVKILDRQSITDIIQLNKKNSIYEKAVADNFEYSKDYQSESYFQPYYRELLDILGCFINLFTKEKSFVKDIPMPIFESFDYSYVSATSTLKNPLRERNSQPINTSPKTPPANLNAHALNQEEKYLSHASAASTLSPPLQENTKPRPTMNNNHKIHLTNLENISTEVKATSVEESQSTGFTVPAITGAIRKKAIRYISQSEADDVEKGLNILEPLSDHTNIEESQSTGFTFPTITGAIRKKATRDISQSEADDVEKGLNIPEPLSDHTDKLSKENPNFHLSLLDGQSISSEVPSIEFINEPPPSSLRSILKLFPSIDSSEGASCRSLKSNPNIPKKRVTFIIPIEEEPNSPFHDIDPNIPKEFFEKLGANPFKIKSVGTITILKCFPGKIPLFYSAYQTRGKLVQKF